MQAYVTLEEKHVVTGGRENSWKIKKVFDYFKESVFLAAGADYSTCLKKLCQSLANWSFANLQ